LPNGTVVPVWTGGDIVTPLLKSLGKHDLLAFINARWKSYQYPDWDLWQHEFSKHAVCPSLFFLDSQKAHELSGRGR
jgi:ribonuclease T2